MLNLIGRKRLKHLVLLSYCFLANTLFSSDFPSTVNFSKFKNHEWLFHNDKLIFMKYQKSNDIHFTLRRLNLLLLWFSLKPST